MKFINRITEMKELEQMYTLSKKKLFPVMLYGPRRVGKTRLIREFVANKDAIYLFINSDRGQDQTCRYIERVVRNHLKDDYIHFEDLETAMGYLIEKRPAEIIIFDEFQNFTKVAPDVFGNLQNLIDSNENSPQLLIFMGSMSSMMVSIFEDPKRPLYQRVKGRHQLKQMSYPDACSFADELGFKNIKLKTDIYLIFGGYPRYYVAMEDYRLQGKTIMDIIDELVLRTNAILKNEVRDVLLMEFGSARAQYYDILEAIAKGHTQRNEISGYMGLKSTSLSPFLKDLIEKYGYVRYELPMLEGKHGVYTLNNPFFTFWFRYIRPNLDLVVQEDFATLHDIIKKDIDSHLGKRFNDLVAEIIPKKLNYPDIGRQWGAMRTEKGRTIYEIDVVGINRREKRILFCEVKYRNRKTGPETVVDLLSKASMISRYRKYKKEFLIVSRSGFNKKALDIMQENDVMHWTFDELVS